MTEASFEPPLSADDPRLGEWLDGRLPEAEAAQVARLVAASPDLTRLVADLRRQKAALAALPVSPPPAGFVQDVLAALDAAGDGADDDAEVEAEWRRIERERLEEEIAEARADAAEPADEPMRHRWPWLALAGALAAGVLAAIVINRPGGMGDREVALVEGQPADGGRRERLNENQGASKPRAEIADTWLEESAAGTPAGKRDDDTASDKASQLAREPANGQATRADGSAVEAGNAKAALANSAGSSPPAAAPRMAAADEAPESLRRLQDSQVRTVTYRIRTAADRRRLEDLLAASGSNRRRAAEGKAAADRERAEFGKREKADGSRDAEGLADPAAPAGERIVVSGPAPRIAGLAAALEAAAGLSRNASAEGGGLAVRAQAPPAGPVGDGPQNGAEAESDRAAENQVVLVIEIVDESGAGSEEARP